MTILQFLFLVVLLIILAILIFQLVTIPFYFYAMIRGAFYAPTPMSKVTSMVELVQKWQKKTKKPVTKMVDLGSGDGRIVLAFAQAGIRAEGWDINPVLVWYARLKIWHAHTQHPAPIYLKDFWHENLNSFDVVTLYGITRIMPKLEKKFDQELKPGAIVISNHFQFPHWVAKDKIGDVILYQKSAA